MVEIGTRVKLVMTDDPYTRLKPGDTGIVTDITTIPHFGDPDEGIHYLAQRQIWISWDSGSRLALIEGKDIFEEIIPDEQTEV